jgi:1-acyl-sn-glycerol-3-phosphate acyltransferase
MTGPSDPLGGDPLAGDPLAGDPAARKPRARNPATRNPAAGDPAVPATGWRRVALAWWYAFARGLVEVVCRTYWRAEIVGREHVPTSGAYVLAPVHRSNIDTLLAGCVTRRRLRFMGKDSLWKYPAVGKAFTSLGGFPVHRGTPDREALRICEAALRAGEPVVLFPEGTRQSGPVVQPLFEGAVFVAGRAGVPILPVGFGGSEWAMTKGSRKLHPVKVAITIGAPIEIPRTEGGRVSRRQVAETTDRLHAELQRLFSDALARAGRPVV